MRIHLVSVAQRIPAWLATGYQDYARRLTGRLDLRLIEIPLGRAPGLDPASERRIRAALPEGAYLVALDEAGLAWSSRELAAELARWQGLGTEVALLVGGPDGLPPGLLASADHRWSLSRLTFPHALVRLVVVEQLYRAVAIQAGHPYHRD